MCIHTYISSSTKLYDHYDKLHGHSAPPAGKRDPEASFTRCLTKPKWVGNPRYMWGNMG